MGCCFLKPFVSHFLVCVCRCVKKTTTYFVYTPHAGARALAGRSAAGAVGPYGTRKGNQQQLHKSEDNVQTPGCVTSFVDCCRCPSKLADVGTVSFCFFMLPASTLPPFASQSACPRKDTAVARYLLVAWRSMLCGRISFRQCLTRKEGHATKETTQKRENHVADKRRHNSKLPNIGAPRHEAGVARFVTREGAGRSDQAC